MSRLIFGRPGTMKRFVDACIGIGRICVGVVLVTGMFQFAIAQSEPPLPQAKQSLRASQQPLSASAVHGAKP